MSKTGKKVLMVLGAGAAAYVLVPQFRAGVQKALFMVATLWQASPLSSVGKKLTPAAPAVRPAREITVDQLIAMR